MSIERRCFSIVQGRFRQWQSIHSMNEALNSGYTLLKGRTNVFAEFGLITLAYNMKRFVDIKIRENMAENMQILQENWQSICESLV